MTYRALLFDLDGTLVDTAPDYISALNRLLREHNMTTFSIEDVSQLVTNGSFGLVQQTFTHITDQTKIRALTAQLMDYYHDHQLEQAALYVGIERMLKRCEELAMPWGIVTNKPEANTLPLLRHLDLRPHVVVCPDHVSQPKPSAEPIFLACDKLAIDPAQTIYVGDHRRDIVAGNSAGCTTVAVGWGYVPADDPIETWQADQVCHTTQQLTDYLQL